MSKRNKQQSKGLTRRVLDRYAAIPQQIHSPRLRERNKAQRLIAATICIPLILGCAGYILSQKLNRDRIDRENAAYAALYTTPEPTQTVTLIQTATTSPSPTPVPTAAPTAVPTGTPTAVPTETPSPVPTATATQALTKAPTASPTPVPTDTPTPSPVPTRVPTPSPEPVFDSVLDETRTPHQSPDPETLIYALETPGAIQDSFADLLSMNPETIGYLTVGNEISLPVVQRTNDNLFYLDHNFEGNESNAGTVFLDGSNLLVPEDLCLILYGHNMRNGTMFNALNKYAKVSYLKQNPVLEFDTIYKNRSYVPFAVFTASMDSDDKSYINIRQFLFDETTYELFVLKMEKLSVIDIPVDIRYGDPLLLLVTCEYTHNNGRLVVACRALRDDESADMIAAKIAAAKKK